jgi:toxin FitB
LILVDTNVVSETSRLRPSPQVALWLSNNEDQLRLPAMVLAELRYGVEKLDVAPPRTALEAWLSKLTDHFARRMMPFDAKAAEAHGRLRAHMRRIGRTLDAQDSYIAAIALARNLPLATRNVKDFAGTGVVLVNPWGG